MKMCRSHVGFVQISPMLVVLPLSRKAVTLFLVAGASGSSYPRSVHSWMRVLCVLNTQGD